MTLLPNHSFLQEASGTLKLFESGTSYAQVNKSQVPDNFTTTGSIVLIEWYSGSVLANTGLFADITVVDTSSLGNEMLLGEDGYCSALNPCNHNEGDCDFDTQCDGFNSTCIDNSCPSELGFPTGTDCCHDACGKNSYQAGQVGFCNSTCPCEADEGHCQSDDQCIPSHTCLPGSCPISLGFSNATSCCQDVGCGYGNVESGLLVSPNYPNFYKNMLSCYLNLTTEPGKVITIEFESFDVSSFQN